MSTIDMHGAFNHPDPCASVREIRSIWTPPLIGASVSIHSSAKSVSNGPNHSGTAQHERRGPSFTPFDGVKALLHSSGADPSRRHNPLLCVIGKRAAFL